MITAAKISGLIELALPDLTAAIMSDPDGKRPKKPYATFKIGGEQGLGMPLKIYNDSDDYPTTKITETIQRVKKATVEINFFTLTESQILIKQKKKVDVVDKVARLFCNEFLERLYLVQQQDYMQTNEFSLLDTTDFSDVGVYLGDKHERRAICELTLNYVGEVSEDIPFIEQQTGSAITGTYIDDAETEL